jgi:KUP system potassium uptake protein
MDRSGNYNINKLSFKGVIITIGIVFGALGTSPLYVLKAVTRGTTNPDELLIYGSMSAIFWTITLLTTIKYVLITLNANNKGEGGIYALFALLKKKPAWAAIVAMVGAGALFADGVITPAITVTSSIEGLQIFNPNIPVVAIVLFLFAILFFIQRYGTNIVGVSFGPIMTIWFSMLFVLGLVNILDNPAILKALNPCYAFRFIAEYPGGFILLGSIFLATTGAEALYSDLGRCGIKNIRISWIFVKIALLANYFGQCAWIIGRGGTANNVNPFFGIMPEWFLAPGIIIATSAALIAGQTLISGSFTMISEAISLNFWPKARVLNLSSLKGQVYVPFVNTFLWIACSFVVIFFRESSGMEAAYGLSITLAMIATTLLLSYYLLQIKKPIALIVPMLLLFLTVEGGFLAANLYKFRSGGWFTIMLTTAFFLIMYGWYFGRKLKNRYVSFVDLDNYTDMFKELTTDESVPIAATNLVYIVKADKPDQVESKVIQSIFHKQPKRAKTYWLLHVDIKDDPHTLEYKVTHIVPGVLIRIDFYLGFKVEPKINLYFREVLEDLKNNNEIDIESVFESIKKHNIPADFKFILIDRVISRDYKLSRQENTILLLHGLSTLICISDVKALNLDAANTIEEKVPIVIPSKKGEKMERIVRSDV